MLHEPPPPPSHAYMVGTFFFVGIFALAYYCAGKSTRRAMLWAAMAFWPVAPLFEILNRDYWCPTFLWPIGVGEYTFGIESFVLAMTFGGLSAGAFDAIHRRRGYRELTGITMSSYTRLLVAGLAALVAIFALIIVFKMNSVHAHILALPVIWAGFLLGVRPRWAVSSILTAVPLTAVMVVFYFLYFIQIYPQIIDAWWMKEVMWGAQREHFPYYWWKVPVEEFAWAASNALYLGPAVRFCMELSLRNTWPCTHHESRLQ